MKKIFTLFAALCTVFSVSAATYGILVNDKLFYEASQLDGKDYQDRDQFLASVSLEVGDTWCVYDETNKAKFTIALETGENSAKGNFSEGEAFATCNEAGCYDFYIKLKWEDNSMWVQSGSNCTVEGREINQGGGDTPGGDPTGDKDYLLKGWCNDKDIETPTAEELFECGTLTYEFTGDATYHKGWFFILVCEPGQVIGEQYMTKGVDDPSGTHTTLYKDGFEKFGAPEGMQTFYLYDNGDGTFEFSIVPLDGKTLVGGCAQGVENTKVSDKAHKAIIDGQLRIIRGDKVFDATGRQL